MGRKEALLPDKSAQERSLTSNENKESETRLPQINLRAIFIGIISRKNLLNHLYGKTILPECCTQCLIIQKGLIVMEFLRWTSSPKNTFFHTSVCTQFSGTQLFLSKANREDHFLVGEGERMKIRRQCWESKIHFDVARSTEDVPNWIQRTATKDNLS